MIHLCNLDHLPTCHKCEIRNFRGRKSPFSNSLITYRYFSFQHGCIGLQMVQRRSQVCTVPSILVARRDCGIREKAVLLFSIPRRSPGSQQSQHSKSKGGMACVESSMSEVSNIPLVVHMQSSPTSCTSTALVVKHTYYLQCTCQARQASSIMTSRRILYSSSIKFECL